MDTFYERLGPKKTKKIQLAVMDVWKAFRKSTQKNVPQAAILFDKFHVMKRLGESLDKVRKMEYAAKRERPLVHQGAEVYYFVEQGEALDGRKALKKLLGPTSVLIRRTY
ncbi:MAG: transposase [Deltaproteobacteria bacterium]|nr:transposase [Deltaproteobacteria bacterium]